MKLTFDDFFRRAAQAAELDTQQDLASLLGVNRSAVTQAKKRNAVPESWIMKLSRDLGLNPAWLESGMGTIRLGESSGPVEEEFAGVPKVRARLCAGGGSFEVNDGIEGYYAFRRPWLLRKGSESAMVLMDVTGTSMEPEIRDGDTLLIDQSQTGILAGSIYAVGVEDTVMVKRMEKRPGALVLHSDNPEYAPVVLRGDEIEGVRVIGRVVWACREYR